MTTDWPSFLLGGMAAVLIRYLWDVYIASRREKRRKQIVSDIDGAIVLFAHIPHAPTLTDDDATDAIAALEKEWQEKMDNS